MTTVEPIPVPNPQVPGLGGLTTMPPDLPLVDLFQRWRRAARNLEKLPEVPNMAKAVLKLELEALDRIKATQAQTVTAVVIKLRIARFYIDSGLEDATFGLVASALADLEKIAERADGPQATELPPAV